MPLPLPAVGAVTAAPLAPVTAVPAATPVRYRPLRLRAYPSTTSSPSTSAVSSPRPPPSARHSRKHLAGRGDAPSRPTKDRVFFLDVNPICFRGSQRSLSAFARWLALFFAHVSLRDPVVAVFDGAGGNEYRRRLMPSYKAHRTRGVGTGADSRVVDVLRECNVPIVQLDGYEADDVVATLTEKVLQKGYRVVIGSPDKDFKQLISEDVQLVMPIPEIGRWSFYTLRHYVAQYKCDPTADLSLRCFMGDEADGVPGIQNLAPGFGRKTAVKLLNKHGSLENLLKTAAIRTVGKEYAQDVLVKHADYLRKNYEVLSLKSLTRDGYPRGTLAMTPVYYLISSLNSTKEEAKLQVMMLATECRDVVQSRSTLVSTCGSQSESLSSSHRTQDMVCYVSDFVMLVAYLGVSMSLRGTNKGSR